MNNDLKVCSAGTIEALEALINRFYHSENYTIHDNQAFNSKTGKRLGKVEYKKKRFTYYA